jgi:hypothetical protein
MALFKKDKRSGGSSAPRWTPTVDLTTARPAVLALANTPAMDDGGVRLSIRDFGRLSERPPLEVAVGQITADPHILDRPWIWLVAVMEAAVAAGDDHLAAAGLSWACYWTYNLVPRNDMGAFMELELDPIPAGIKAQIHTVGAAAAARLPPDFVVVGDETGSIRAELLAATSAQQLGL